MHVVDFPDVPIAIHLHEVAAFPVELQRSDKQMRSFRLERTPHEPRILKSFTQHTSSAATVEPCPDSFLHRSNGESLGGSCGRNLQARAPTDPGIAVPTRTDTNIDRNPRQAADTSVLPPVVKPPGSRAGGTRPHEGCAAPSRRWHARRRRRPELAAIPCREDVLQRVTGARPPTPRSWPFARVASTADPGWPGPRRCRLMASGFARSPRGRWPARGATRAGDGLVEPAVTAPCSRLLPHCPGPNAMAAVLACPALSGPYPPW